MTSPRFLAVDFFCGAGGTTRGLIDAGGYVIAGIDNDGRCRDTYVRNNKNRGGDREHVEFLEYSIFPATKDHPEGAQQQLMEELDRRISEKADEFPDIPLLFAICAPCQPFTTVSKKALTKKRVVKRAKDRDLLNQALKFVRKFKPEYVLSENVAGIQSDRYGGVWQRFESGLRELGYLTGTRIVCASNFGVPQYRKRSILIAAKAEVSHPPVEDSLFPSSLMVPDSDPMAQAQSVANAIGYLPRIGAGEQHPKIKNHKTRSLSELNIKRISVAKPGETNRYLDSTKYGDLSLACHRRVNKKLGVRCFNDVYTRMRGDLPAPTITTKCHSISNGRFGHFDVKQNRGISLKEAALLQSFPKGYVFYPVDSIGQVAKMVGNAVPPKLAKFFANYLVAD